MAVVIHDFEVEMQPERQSAGEQAKEQPPVELPEPEIEELLRRQVERDERLCAH